MTRREISRVRRAAGLLAASKARSQRVLDAWSDLPDVDASSGQLEQAIELLGRVERDLDSAADDAEAI